MAGCRICKRDMLTARGCAVGTVHIHGKVYPRIKAGDGRDFNPYMEEGERCGNCGAMKGFFHHFGCDIERCPVCGMQMISCDCEDVFYEGIAEE